MENLEREEHVNGLEFLDGVEPPPHPVSEYLQGLTINSPFLWQRDDAYVEQVANQARNLGATTIRVFINDLFESTTGKFDDQALKNIERISDKLEDIKLIVCLFDAYTLLHQDRFNIDYPPSPLSSPYYLESPEKTKKLKQLSFFTDPETKAHVNERFRHIVKYLKNSEHIAAWEVANELELPNVKGVDKQKTLTKWYEEAIATIRSVDSKRPIVTGLAKPWLIDESSFENKNIVNSFHVYPLQLGILNGLRKFVSKSLLPLAGLETGVGEKMEPVIKYPSFLQQVLGSVIRKNTLYAGNFGIWKIDNYQDGYKAPRQEDIGFFNRLAQKIRQIQSDS